MDSVRIDRAGTAWTVTIARPQVRNAVDGATAHRLADALRAFEADAEARVEVLTGAGGCAPAYSVSTACRRRRREAFRRGRRAPRAVRWGVKAACQRRRPLYILSVWAKASRLRGPVCCNAMPT
jgi:1,4-dihydroxy-2-naphthoyl-CoA synthase